MVAVQDTPSAPRLERLPLRKVFRVASGAETAEAADLIVQQWQADWSTHPAPLVLVEESTHAALVEQLVQRARGLTAGPGVVEELGNALHLLVDAGATLILGGRPAGPSNWEPTLFVNLQPGAGVLQDKRLRGPILLIGRLAGPEDEGDFLGELAEETERIHLKRGFRP